MKKTIFTLALIAASQTLFAQGGFLNKIKSKVTDAVQKPADAAAQQAAPTAPGSTKFTDPTAFGTLIYTFSKDDLNKHMGGSEGGFDLWFQNVQVANNQLQFQVVDYDQVYNYSGGQLSNTGSKTTQQENKQVLNSEFDLMSKNFTTLDMTNAMLKKGPHVGSGMIPGKPMQTLTFNGKEIGSYYMFNLAHNADSSAIAVAAVSMGTGGMSYSLVTSGGVSTKLPQSYGSQPIISPNGKMAAAIVPLPTGKGADVYISNGSKVTVGVWDVNYAPWIRNSGAVYNIGDQKNIYKNGELFHAFDNFLFNNPHTFFISDNDKTMCWEGDHGVYFSDGTAVENGMSPHRVIIDNKEVIIFLAVNVGSGKVYLCRHDL